LHPQLVKLENLVGLLCVVIFLLTRYVMCMYTCIHTHIHTYTHTHTHIHSHSYSRLRDRTTLIRPSNDSPLSPLHIHTHTHIKVYEASFDVVSLRGASRMLPDAEVLRATGEVIHSLSPRFDDYVLKINHSGLFNAILKAAGVCVCVHREGERERRERAVV